MNDYSINAVITLDTSEYKKGINEAQKSTKNFSGNFSKLTSSLNVITHSHPLLSLLIIMIIPAHITYLCSGQASLPFVDEKSKSQRS